MRSHSILAVALSVGLMAVLAMGRPALVHAGTSDQFRASDGTGNDFLNGGPGDDGFMRTPGTSRSPLSMPLGVIEIGARGVPPT